MYPLLLLLTLAPAGTPDAGQVLRECCAGCHRPGALETSFTFAADLDRLAGSRYVVKGRPEESKLWAQVDLRKMPPADSPYRWPTPLERQAIHDWIVSLAPAPAGDTPARPTDAGAGEPPPPAGPWARTLILLGKLHLLALHFPIVIILLLAAWDWGCWFAQRSVWEIPYLAGWRLGAVTSAATVALGWVLAGHGGGSSQPEVLLLHRWLGVGVAVVAIIALVLVSRDSRSCRSSWWTRAAVTVCAVLVVAAAHAGGALVWGLNFLTW